MLNPNLPRLRKTAADVEAGAITSPATKPSPIAPATPATAPPAPNQRSSFMPDDRSADRQGGGFWAFRMPIPDRHSEDLFVGVRIEGFKRQSAFRHRDGGQPTRKYRI